MKIKDILVHIISAPLEVPFKFSQGWVYNRSSVIVEVIGSDGTSGFGECLCHGQQAPQIAGAFIENCYKPEVIGKDSLDVEVIWEKLYNRARPFGQQGAAINALSGLDIALWDLNGKQLGQPVSRLLGGRFREKVMAYATGFYRQEGKKYPEDAVKEALSYVDMGFKGMKLKAGFTPKADIEYVRAVRNAVGHDVMLMADFNAAYTQAAARRIILELEPEKVEFFEEPLVPEDIEGYKAIRNLTSSYIAAGEEMFTKMSIKNWLKEGALDIYQPDICSSGGFTECKKMAALTQSYNTMLMPHVWGSGIALAASLQFVSSLPNTPMCDTPVEPLLEYDRSSHPFRLDLINDGVEFSKGYLITPNKPGIGVEINRNILEQYKVK
ncbi:mandelate racemase/muconate lactonizing enzyme family protein [Clostridium oceanicum]|uniref:D-galactarolactone cycloisomerase n=1 Tax=Clostridium oceanicum TaxID=1543 RepID=A0ABN1JAB9_9CLOT